MKIDEDKKANIFRALTTKSLYEAGVEFELDKHYTSVKAVKNKVYAIYREVANDPEKFFIHPDTASLVVDAVSGRSVANRPVEKVTVIEQTEVINKGDIKSLLLGGRDRVAGLINNKLAWLEAHPKALQEESLSQLGTILGILFDKSQIIQGQATEHVAVMSKIDPNMSPDEAIQAIIRSREVMQAEKYS